MGVSKVVLVDPNTQTPEVLMDVTGDDTSASVLLAGNVGTRNDGEKVTGNIPTKTSSNLTVSGATVTAPAGYYASDASATVASGSAGTPTATKGSVSNHSVSVTPSVTNTTGYITGSTKTGTAVSVSASELVSGTKSISANGTGIDVTNYASVNVSVTSSTPPVEGLSNALEFRSPSSFTLRSSQYEKTWDGVLEWTDGTKPWATWSSVYTTLTASNGVLYLRGTGNTHLGSATVSGAFKLTGTDISCNGNIETLLDYETVAKGLHPSMAQSCYHYLFKGCSGLISAPAFPATTLTANCYTFAFYDCTGLTSAPVLPATTLADSCYKYMFYGCTSLVSVPDLPEATMVGNDCYAYMFYGCTALTSAPALPATTLAYNCYNEMFNGCTALTSAPALPATTLAFQCYRCMFYGCTSLTSIPALPATTLAQGCYTGMFYNCTSLKLSTTYDSTSYPYTFRIPKTGTGTSASDALDSMFTNTGGSFTGTPSINTNYYTENPLVEATA